MHQSPDGAWDNPALIEVDDNDSIPALVFKRATERPKQIIAEKRAGVGHWQEVTAGEFVSHVKELARGMYGLGVRKGDSVAILAATSYEWAALDVAILSLGARTVPIYESDSAVQIAHILRDAHVTLVVTQTAQQADLVASVRTDSVKDILSIDRAGIRVLIHEGHAVEPAIIEQSVEELTMDDVATIIYTSGTTGVPKGVKLSHGNFMRAGMQAHDILPELIKDPNSRTLLFLPVAHVLARFVMHCILIGQGRLGFCPDTRTLIHDIETFKPTMMLAVPRVLEKVYNTAAAKTGTGLKGALFSWSAKTARKMSQATAFPLAPKEKDETTASEIPDASTIRTSDGPTFALKLAHGVADTLVLRKIRNILGPNLHTIICGGAPLNPDLANFYRGLGITLLQGYGLSETTGPITVHRPDDNPPDSVGYLWPGNSMKIAEDGELLLKGISVSSGYHNLPEATAESFKDGWFHTGDLGAIDEDGRLSITGRKKELIVTAGGKNVSPEILEHHLGTHPLIGHVLVFGDARPYIGALITLDAEMLPQWLKNHGLDVVSTHEAASLEEVKAAIARAIVRANGRVSRAESIRRYRIIHTEFTVENGYLTPSLKLKRHKVLEDYAQEITEVYDFSSDQISRVGGSIDASQLDSSK
ncbi:long-chain fatty acid--CoA ligase [Actinomycetaceae bacterium WB03_NA08]|uniref:Long-chain fatty acid--CoA ligase n=1 Tax=Scrofimicrobium canadense TaxID=2652290 RepID=A0A6N7W6C3_9ACTO|nr:long-chain fatty acid--CoA ligase [Scrofimicrobium canadense]MSS83982.1 long-chain fatty acid--CoA ligase [Scrofimicrobium canadense]